MEACLYDEAHGFYGSGVGIAGRRGDFITSVEVGPLFGAVVAAWLDACWRGLGRPDPFEVADVGAGPGTWARTIRAAGAACAGALRLTLDERSAAARALHGTPGDRSVEHVPADVRFHVILANELLDNLPVRLAEHDGEQWQEVWVTSSDGVDQECLRPLADNSDLPVALCRVPTSAGLRVPLACAARAWVADALARLVVGGHLLVFDYGATTAELAGRDPSTWLRTYRQHDRGGSPLDGPGTQDITCEVPLDQLPAAHVVARQAEWLRRWGIDVLVEEGRRQWSEGAAAGGLAALRGRSRIREAEALLDEGGLGAFWVLEWTN